MNSAIDLQAMPPGFDNVSLDSQRVFRALLDAMAHPGRIYDVAGVRSEVDGVHPATAAVAMTLLDYETPLWTDLDRGALALQWMRFHCGVPEVDDTASAAFALVTKPMEMPGLGRFCQGTDRNPHHATTLILEVEGLVAGRGRRLTGPGIKTHHLLEVEGLPGHFWTDRRGAGAFFPTGVDVIFTCHDRIAALPRTTNGDESVCM